MLELRPICENCAKLLPNNSSEAMICTYECTFCKDCVTKILENVCPNCGGGFESRPTRPSLLLQKDPAAMIKHFKPVQRELFRSKLEKNRNIDPRER